MRFIDFDSMPDFAEKLIQASVSSGDKNRYCGVAVCNYEVATGLLEELARRSQKFRHIDLSAPEVSGYLKEYAIMVTEKGIYCEKMYKPNNMRLNFRGCTIPVYVHGECFDEIENLVNKDSFAFNIIPKEYKKAEKQPDNTAPSVYRLIWENFS